MFRIEYKTKSQMRVGRRYSFCTGCKVGKHLCCSNLSSSSHSFDHDKFLRGGAVIKSCLSLHVISYLP